MRNLSISFLALICTVQFAFAQCPPPGFPQSGNTCPQAPILCENLDGYCNTINNNNQQQSFPGCGGNFVLNNDEWFAFYAGSTTITIQVTPSNCNGNGNNNGLQGGIYNGCGGPVMDVQCPCSTQPFVLTATNYVIGQIYWFVLDGCAGAVCDYSIDVLAGSTVGAPPNSPGDITGPTPVCAGSTSTYAVPVVTGATIYNWTLTPPGLGTMSGGNNQDVNVAWGATASGTAQLCLMVANACYPNPDTVCQTITVIPKPTATLTGGGVICTGNSTTIDLTVTFTGTGPWEFTPTLNGSPQTPITTSNNPYIMTVTQTGTWGIADVHPVGLNCPGTTSGTAVVTQVTLSPTSTNVAATCGSSNGSINLSVSGGNTPYAYNWSNGVITQDQSDIPPGTYVVTVTDNNNCTATHTVVVADNTITITTSGTTMPNTTCNTNNNGSIDLSVSPGGTYVYSWSSGATTQDLTNLAPGSYAVTVTSGVSCTATAEFTIADQPNEPNATFSTVESTCDLTNGSINLSVTGGVTPYTFIWSTGAITEDLNNILAGSYQVTVTGANGCTDVADISVSNNNPIITISTSAVNNTNCNGIGNGSINVTVSPTGTYTFLWSSGATTEDIGNLLPDSYTLTVTGQGSCSETAFIEVPDAPLEPVITYTTIQSTCDQTNGSINVSVSGGTTPYTYQWSNGALTQDLNNVLAGTYFVTVTGANGCTDDADITVDNNNPPINVTASVVANTTCNGNFTGAINASVNPPGMYTFLWSTGATTLSISGLAAETYTITVTGAGSCIQISEFTVPENANVPVVNPSFVQSTCDLTNGSASISVSGSVPPYTFMWSNGATTQNITGVLAGYYEVTVTGVNGCTTVEAVDIPNFNPPFSINANVLNNTICNNGNGSIDVSINPPGAYTYTWSNGATTQDLTNLLPGPYELTVSAGGSCVEVESFFIEDNPNQPNLTFSQVDANCGLNNGSINLSVTGGVTPYSYSWSNGASTQDLNNVPGDVYNVTVTGNNGCSSVEGIVLNDNEIPVSVDAVVTGKTSCITNNGSIALTITPSNATILWENGTNAIIRNNLAPGIYSVTVSAGGTCTETADFEIFDNTEYPALTTEITPGYCSIPNGSVDLEVTGGIEPYKYKWSNLQTNQDIANLAQGTYTVTVTTAAGCSAETTVFVPNNDIPIQLNGVVYDNLACVPPLNGAIDLLLDPEGYNYNFNWSNGLNTQNLANIPPGIYTVTVKLGSSCTATGTYEVLNAAIAPNLSVAGIPATCGLSNGGANLSVTGATDPYTYHWSNNASTEDLSNVLPGNYAVTVTDFFACSATTSVTIANNNIALNITNVMTENTSCATPNGALNITVTPTGGYGYSWSNGSTTEDLSGLPPGSYSVTVTAGSSCVSSATFQVVNNTSDPVIVLAITAAICTNPNGAIDLAVSGATTPYLYNWSNASTTEDLTALLPGTYKVTVTGANGCTTDTILFVPNNSSTFSLSGATQALTNCAAANGAIDLTVTPAGPYTYAWSTSSTTQDIANLVAGIYTVSVTETGTCTASISFIISDDRTYPTSAQTIAAELCNLQNGSVNLTVSGGEIPYSFSWASGQMTEDLINISDGVYAVTISGANKCTTTATAFVPDNSVTFSIAGAPTNNTSCVVNNGAINITVDPTLPGSGLNYTYGWSNSLTTQDLSNIAAGNYVVTVSAGGTCTSTANYTIVNDTQAPTIAEVVSAAFCGQSSGSVDVSVTGGQGPYSYLWSTMAVSEDLLAIPPGNYALTVTGSNGCTSVDTYVIPENVTIPSISGSTTPNTSCVANNGGIVLTVTPALTYTYHWAGGQTTPFLQNVQGGSYTVTVSAGGSCTAQASFNVPSNVAIVNIVGSLTNVLCFGNNTGAININVGGGTEPYSYNWLPAAGNIEDLSSLNAGMYTVTATDINGCSATASFTVTQPANSVLVACSNVSDVTAPTVTDGKGAVTISGGTAPYNVDWNPGGAQSNVVPGVFNLTNLAQGAYQVTVTDANGCTAPCGFNIGLVPCTTAVGTMGNGLLSRCGPGCITANYSAVGQILDPNDALQFILHEGSGNQIVNEIARSNQPTFCFNQATMDYGTTYYIAAVAGNANAGGNVILGAYCSVVSAPTPIVFQEKPVANINQPIPLNCEVRETNLIGSSSLPGATYAWSTVLGTLIGNVTQANAKAGLAASYQLVVNVNGCKDTASVQVTDISNQPLAIVAATPDDLLDCVINQITLSGTAEGTFNANTIWISNGNTYSPGTTIQIDEPGTYQFVILDTLTRCSDTAVIIINEDLVYPALFINPPTLLTCANPTATLVGGSPFQGIQFRWATISGTDTTYLANGTSVAVSAPGTYWLFGIDPVNKCKNATFTVVNANQISPTADAGVPFSMKCYGETANLDGTGSFSIGGMTFKWTTGNGDLLSGANTPSPVISKPGTYVLLVTDAVNGCTDTDVVLITPVDPTALATVNQPPCYGDKGSIRVDEVIGGRPPIQFSLNSAPFTTQGYFKNLEPGPYTVVVQDAEGCSTTLSALLVEPAEFQVLVTPEVTIGLGDSYQISAQINLPLTQIQSVLWTPSTGLSCDTCLSLVASPFLSTQYKVSVKTDAGCRDEATLRLLVDRRVDVYIPNIFSPNGDGENDEFTIFADQKAVVNIHYLQVYSRWGELLWERHDFPPNDVSLGWDGTFQGLPMNPAVFVYQAELEFIDGRKELFKGDVTLER